MKLTRAIPEPGIRPHDVERRLNFRSLGILLAVALALACQAAPAQELARTPPMGWNSWDAYGFTLDEAAFKANAQVLAGLKAYGWQYAVIDEGWYMNNPAGADRETRQYQLDKHGRLMPAASRFPSAVGEAGLRPLGEWTHAQGLKLGIHIVRGIPKAALAMGGQIAGSHFTLADAADTADTCPWDDGNYGIHDNAAGQAYYDSVLKLYAAWGVDFLKVDCIANAPYRRSEIQQIASAIGRSGRAMLLSLSPGPTDPAHAAEVAHYSQMWRISNDIWDGWSFAGEFPIGIATAFETLARWNDYAGPGHWPDADMLPFGELSPHPGWGDARSSRLRPQEQQSQFLLWAIAHSPLILSCNLTQLDSATRALVTNPRVIDLNQGGWRSRPLTTPLPPGLEEVRVWIASRGPSGAGDTVVALFNVGAKRIAVQTPWKALGLQEPIAGIQNVITGELLADHEVLAIQLGPHASAAYQARGH